VTGDRKATKIQFLFQQLSVTLQWYYAVTFGRSFEILPYLDWFVITSLLLFLLSAYGIHGTDAN